MNRILTQTTYLEMLSSPQRPVGPLPPASEIDRLHAPSVDDYRFLYNSVGREYNWIDRNLLPDEQLRRIIQDAQVEIYVLKVAGQPAGYAELDCRKPDEIELAYFGLFPPYLGKGLGKYFLGWTVDRAWVRNPKRVWVHTCDLDHEAALPLYQKAGFAVYDVKLIEQLVNRDAGRGHDLRR
jgi:GNAT superfamily N-acetyltransferase